jgi:hypothetical protein
MSHHERSYKRLPGKYKKFYSIRTLWQAPDHLLSVDTTLSAEYYKRFYYNDIQALLVVRTDTGQLWNALFGVFALPPGLLAAIAFANDNPAGAGVGSIIAVLFLILLVVNIVRGPTCVTLLQTAVQIEKLLSLGRLKTANRALDRIRPQIETAQGPLAVPVRSAVEARVAEAAVAATALAPVRPAVSQTSAPAGPISLLWHRLLFGLLVLGGGAVALLPVLHRPAPAVVAGFLFLAATAMVIVALVRQQGAGLRTSLRAATWVALGLVVVDGIESYVVYLIAAARHPEHAFNQWELFKVTAQMHAIDHPVMFCFNLLFAVTSIGIGLLGLVFARGGGRSGTAR